MRACNRWEIDRAESEGYFLSGGQEGVTENDYKNRELRVTILCFIMQKKNC